MIDLKRLRDEPAYRAGIERKRVRAGLLDDVLATDEERRAWRRRVEEARTLANEVSKRIGRAGPSERGDLVVEARARKDQLVEYEASLSALEARLHELALEVPNPADASVPDGGEDDAEVVRIVGEPAGAPRLDHAAYAEQMGWVETAKAVEAGGPRFASLMREAVLLEFALVRWVLGRLVEEGFTPVVPPVLVREHAMQEAGFFPTDRQQVYAVDGGELFLVGTSEVPLSALHRGEIVDAAALPLRYAGFSTNFRREAGTYGKDTRGIFRVHQFDKVEMFSYAYPDDSWAEHERLLAIEEALVRALGLPYRVVNIAARDLGAAAAKKYDIEVWLPSEGRYREATSCSNYLDYSARRLGTRLRDGGGTRLVHTLNGTACAVGRTLVFLFEHCQRPDGVFAVPEVLVPYCDFAEVKPPG